MARAGTHDAISRESEKAAFIMKPQPTPSYALLLFVFAPNVHFPVTGRRNHARPAPAPAPDPRSWFVQSYRDGVITVLHEGKTYTATCESSRSFNNGSSALDE